MISTLRSGLQSVCAQASTAGTAPELMNATAAARATKVVGRTRLLPGFSRAGPYRPWSMALPFQVRKICSRGEALPSTDHLSPGDRNVLSNETIELAHYAINLRFEDLPAEVVQRAKDCIIDTAAAIIYGNTIPWSGTVVGYAQRMGPGGKSRILGAAGAAVQPAVAALANGTLSHAFELDNVVINPGAGMHGGAPLFPTRPPEWPGGRGGIPGGLRQ